MFSHCIQKIIKLGITGHSLSIIALFAVRLRNGLCVNSNLNGGDPVKCSVKAWVEKEFSAIHFGDKRLNYRFKSIATELTKQCGKTLASSFSTWKEIKASYRFFANTKVTNSKMLEAHVEQTKNRIKECNRVLMLQDTTYLDYNNRPKTEGLDLTFRSKLSTESQGLMLHNTLEKTWDILLLTSEKISRGN